MALVNKLELLNADKPRVHDEIAGTYCTSKDGDVPTNYDARIREPKYPEVSQIVQCGLEAIARLREFSPPSSRAETQGHATGTNSRSGIRCRPTI
jgi:hypothetical protein